MQELQKKIVYISIPLISYCKHNMIHLKPKLMKTIPSQRTIQVGVGETTK